MDRNLVALKPALVWKHFAEIVRIPRPSSHEEKIRRYILDFARAQGLESKEDAAHNVYVRKPASKGMEDRKGRWRPCSRPPRRPAWTVRTVWKRGCCTATSC